MTFPTWITLFRLLLVPVFVIFTVKYSTSFQSGQPEEVLRWIAIGIFILAAASDGIDGWLARKYQQESLLGSILDPLTDKALLLSGLITLSLVEWGEGWSLPQWFIALVILRDLIIIVGIWILYFINRHVPIKPHWTGKVCTVTQMVALSWVMLKFLNLSPLYPIIIATVFTIWSGWAYIQTGISQLPKKKQSDESA